MTLFKLFRFLFIDPFTFHMADGDGGSDDGDGDGDGDSEDGDKQWSVPHFEGVPDKFIKDGVPDFASLNMSYTELESKISSAGQEAVEAYKKENSPFVPKMESEYTFDISGIAPEGSDFKIEDDDAMLSDFRKFALENGMSQESFNQGVRFHVASKIKEAAAMAEAAKELGENSQERIDAIDLKLMRALDDKTYQAFSNLLDNPGAIVALEQIFDSKKDPLFKDNGDGGEEKLTREEIREMMRDPRYTGIGGQVDKAYHAKVQQLYQGLHQKKAS